MQGRNSKQIDVGREQAESMRHHVTVEGDSHQKQDGTLSVSYNYVAICRLIEID